MQKSSVAEIQMVKDLITFLYKLGNYLTEYSNREERKSDTKVVPTNVLKINRLPDINMIILCLLSNLGFFETHALSVLTLIISWE